MKCAWPRHIRSSVGRPTPLIRDLRRSVLTVAHAGMPLPDRWCGKQSRFLLVGRWRDPNGTVVHARRLSTSGKVNRRGPYARGLRTECGRPHVRAAFHAVLTEGLAAGLALADEHGGFSDLMIRARQTPRDPGLRRVDFLDFRSPITCERCIENLEYSFGARPSAGRAGDPVEDFLPISG